MIRTMMTMFALGTLTISSASAMAATKVQARAHHQTMKTPVVAAAEGSAPPAATDEAKPADAKPAKDATAAKAHKGHKAKASAKAKDATGAETSGTPAPEATQK
jgi:hypothetical protein